MDTAIRQSKYGRTIETETDEMERGQLKKTRVETVGAASTRKEADQGKQKTTETRDRSLSC